MTAVTNPRRPMKLEATLLALFLVFVVCSLLWVGVSSATEPQQQPQVNAVSFGPDMVARRQNTPKLFEALNRYARADKAFRAEFGTYTGPQDVNYEKLKPLLDELRDSVADVNERLKNFDSLQAKGRTSDEVHTASSNGSLGRPNDPPLRTAGEHDREGSQ